MLLSDLSSGSDRERVAPSVPLFCVQLVFAIDATIMVFWSQGWESLGHKLEPLPEQDSSPRLQPALLQLPGGVVVEN